MGFCMGYGKQTFGENGPFRSHFSVSNRPVCRSFTEFKAFMGRIQQKGACIRCKNELRCSAKISISPRLTPTTVFKLNLGNAWRDLSIISWEQVTFYCVHSVCKGESPFQKQSPGFTLGLYFDIYRPISFKLDMMIETTKLYILISVWMTFKDAFVCEIKNSSVHFKYVATACWFVEAYAKFICIRNWYSRERTVDVILWNIPLTSPCVVTLANRLFQTWHDARHI